MKVLRSREINPHNSPSNKTPKPRNRRTQSPQPPSPSTPSQVLEQKHSSNPSPMSSTPSSPNPCKNNLGFSVDSESGSRGSNLRRSSRLASKLGVKEDETQGNTLISSQNVDKDSVFSSSLKKRKVFDEEDGSLDKKEQPSSEPPPDSSRRRSSRLASRNEGEVKSVEKRRSGESLSSDSKKARVFEGSLEGKCLLPSLEDELREGASKSGDDSGGEKSGEENESISEKTIDATELKLKETLLGSDGDRHEEEIMVPDSPVQSNELGVGTSFGSTLRRSGRLSAIGGKGGFSSLSKALVFETRMEESSIVRDATNSVGDQVVPLVGDGDNESKDTLAAETGEFDGLGRTEVNLKAVADEGNVLIGNSRRRSERLAASESRIDFEMAGPSNFDSTETKNEDDQSGPSGKRRYSKEEKGKAKFDLNLRPEEQPEFELGMNSGVPALGNNAALGLVEIPTAVSSESVKQVVRTRARSHALRRERFHDIARQSAAQFAHFRAEEDEPNVTAPTTDSGDGTPEIEDWPGPFSTAMKIIRDRTEKLKAPKIDSADGLSDSAPVIDWLPLKDSVQNCPKPNVPPLQDLCLNILSKHSEAIASLKYVPNEIKEKLTQMLCDSRKMDSRFMDLLVSEVPEVVRVKDCSWMTEEQMIKSFGECDTSFLSTLQLDLCGRCMPDYVLRTTLARAPNSLPSLVALSLKGACRVTDSGLSALVASAPFLKSINLSQCSLITSAGISAIADRLGLLLRELYLDDCQSIDAMLILPALKRLKCLEVLSLADMQTVSDDFIGQFVGGCNPSMKELGLANCAKLSDAAIKSIAESCSGLCALDLTNLRQLTDYSIGYIANGCPSIQKLKLCRNSFTDEAIAAYLEASGASLTELSLNNIKKVGPHTALSLGKNCARNLLSLDLSWCRKLTNEALGYVVDSCLSLRVLKLFGCTQLSNVFVGGHSNPHVRIIGLKMTPILEHLNVLNSQEGPLRYSSVHAF